MARLMWISNDCYVANGQPALDPQLGRNALAAASHRAGGVDGDAAFDIPPETPAL